MNRQAIAVDKFSRVRDGPPVVFEGFRRMAKRQFRWRSGTLLLYVWMILGLGLSSGCSTVPADPRLEIVRAEAAAVLKKHPSRIDRYKPLAAQGASALDVLEIVVAVEGSLRVRIPDSAFGGSVQAASRTLTVQQLTELVAQYRDAP